MASDDPPAAVTIAIDVTDLNDTQRDMVGLYYWDVDHFVPIEDAVCEIVEDPLGTFTKTCTMYLEHFSTYAAIAPFDSDNDGVVDSFDGVQDQCLESNLYETIIELSRK